VDASPLQLPTEPELPLSTPPGLMLLPPFSNSVFSSFFIFSFLFVLLDVCCGCVKGCSLLI
jgi:hypothetical protein